MDVGLTCEVTQAGKMPTAWAVDRNEIVIIGLKSNSCSSSVAVGSYDMIACGYAHTRSNHSCDTINQHSAILL